MLGQLWLAGAVRLGAVWLVVVWPGEVVVVCVVGVVELVDEFALAIAAPPPATTPVTTSIAARALILCLISVSPPFGGWGTTRRSTRAVGKL
jgi:hypothetical protein